MKINGICRSREMTTGINPKNTVRATTTTVVLAVIIPLLLLIGLVIIVIMIAPLYFVNFGISKQRRKRVSALS